MPVRLVSPALLERALCFLFGEEEVDGHAVSSGSLPRGGRLWVARGGFVTAERDCGSSGRWNRGKGAQT